jgi:hypothetical protein
MKKKLDVDEDATADRLEKHKKKTQSDFMRQLTDLAKQIVEPPPPPPLEAEPFVNEIKRQVNLSFFQIVLFLNQFFLSRILQDLPLHHNQVVDYLAKLRYDVHQL